MFVDFLGGSIFWDKGIESRVWGENLFLSRYFGGFYGGFRERSFYLCVYSVFFSGVIIREEGIRVLVGNFVFRCFDLMWFGV